MEISPSTLILGAVVLAAASFSLGRETSPPAPPVRVAESPAESREDPSDEMPNFDPASGDPHASPMTGEQPHPDDEPAAVVWTPPPAWHTVDSPSPMRLATYSVPAAPGDPPETEVSVSRAGGDMASNLRRWAGQFGSTAEPKQQSRSVKGLDVTVVEMVGTYTGGMDPKAKPRLNWALLAAIVQGSGLPYFFKMTGPAATVRAARATFLSMIDGMRPAPERRPVDFK